MGSVSVAQTGFNTQVLPIGDQEPLLCNTGTAGGLNSTGAVYYNPANLSELEGTSFSLSGSAYTYFAFSAEPIAQFGDQTIDFRGNNFQSIPTSFIMVKQLKSMHVSFSVLIPASFSFEGTQKWMLTDPALNSELRTALNYKEEQMWIGLSAAKSINSQWSFGMSMYLQSFNYLSTTFFQQTQITSNEILTESFLREKYTPYNLLVMAGIQRHGDLLNWGLNITAPNIRLFGNGNYYESIVFRLGNGTLTRNDFELIDEKTWMSTPLNIRTGITLKSFDKALFALDVNYRLNHEYDVFQSAEFDQNYSYSGMIRTSLGSRIQLNNQLNLNTGVALHLPESKSNSDENYHGYYSVSLGGSFKTEHIKTSAGLFYSLGLGENDNDLTNLNTTERYEYTGLYLGTNYIF